MAHPAGRQAPGRNRLDCMTAAHLAGREARKQPEVSHEPLSNGGSNVSAPAAVSAMAGTRSPGGPDCRRAPSRAGAGCATASSCLTTAANCSPTAAPSHLTGPPRPSRRQWPPEAAMTLMTSCTPKPGEPTKTEPAYASSCRSASRRSRPSWQPPNRTFPVLPSREETPCRLSSLARQAI